MLIDREEKVAAFDLIDQLRAEEGNSVTIFCDNAGFGGPNNAIEIVAEWTNWAAFRCEGDSLIDCLEKALHIKTRIEKGIPDGQAQLFISSQDRD